MTEKQFTKGDWTTCVYDICEINKDGEVFCTVATRDVDLIISVLEENEQLKQRNEQLENHFMNKLTIISGDVQVD